MIPPPENFGARHTAGLCRRVAPEVHALPAEALGGLAGLVERVGERLLEAIRATGLRDATLLDVGTGIGVIHDELLAVAQFESDGLGLRGGSVGPRRSSALVDTERRRQTKNGTTRNAQALSSSQFIAMRKYGIAIIR